MNPPLPGWLAVTSKEKVFIPNLDGSGVAFMVEVEVSAWQDPATGELFLDGDALEELDRIKARHLGILAPPDIKRLRLKLGLTQARISQLVQIGEKSWTRWETGKERPSRSINLLLRAMHDEVLTVDYLQSLLPPEIQPGGYLPSCRPAPAAAHDRRPPRTPSRRPGGQRRRPAPSLAEKTD